MTTPTPSYEPGDKVRVAVFHGFPQYSDALAVIATVRGTYSGTNANGKVEMVKDAYKVIFLDEVVGIVRDNQLSPAMPPYRSDLDTIVAWDTLPDEVIIAMIGGPRERT